MTNEERKELEEFFDERYVLRRDCDKKVDKQEEHTSQLHVSIAKIGTKLNVIAAILGGIGSAVLAAVVKIIIGG